MYRIPLTKAIVGAYSHALCAQDATIVQHKMMWITMYSLCQMHFSVDSGWTHSSSSSLLSGTHSCMPECTHSHTQTFTQQKAPSLYVCGRNLPTRHEDHNQTKGCNTTHTANRISEALFVLINKTLPSIGLPTVWKKSLAKYGLVFLAQKKQRSFALNVQCTNRKGGGKKNVASQ